MMKVNKKVLIFIVIFPGILVSFYIIGERRKFNGNSKHESAKEEPTVTLAVVACGYRLQETLTMLKSALLFNHGKSLLHLIIVTEDSLKVGFREKLTDWQGTLTHRFTFQMVSVRFPEKNSEEWKSLFKPCAAQRLFLPSLLSTVDSVLYLDTDTLFLSPISEIWSYFDKFNDSQIAALSSEHEDRNVGWYNRFARHPFYGQFGVNSGVMLMNLTRMRSFQWEDRILPIHMEYKLKITWGDQDLINIMFYFHPDKLYVLPCEFNYRPDHCMYMSICNASTGIQIIHGNRGYFHVDKQPVFSVIYRAMETYQLGKDPFRNFLLPLQDALADDAVVNSNCGKHTTRYLTKAKAIFLGNDYYYS